jgi:hypothetical protein
MHANLVLLEPVDYLVIGHVAHDLPPEGSRLGTAAYSALTAQAQGLRVGVVTACGPETSLEPLNGIPVISVESPQSTTFENIYTQHGRVQYLRARATRIDLKRVPETWRRASIIHLGPIANEMEALLLEDFSRPFLGSLSGWMRQWDAEARAPAAWRNADAARAGGRRRSAGGCKRRR